MASRNKSKNPKFFNDDERQCLNEYLRTIVDNPDPEDTAAIMALRGAVQEFGERNRADALLYFVATVKGRRPMTVVVVAAGLYERIFYANVWRAIHLAYGCINRANMMKRNVSVFLNSIKGADGIGRYQNIITQENFDRVEGKKDRVKAGYEHAKQKKRAILRMSKKERDRLQSEMAKQILLENTQA
jgi:hypothetical protein